MATEKDVLPSHNDGKTSSHIEKDGRPVDRPARKTSPGTLVFYVLTALFVLGVLHEPAMRCYGRASDHVCKRIMTVEQRARRILAHNPLIGNHLPTPCS